LSRKKIGEFLLKDYICPECNHRTKLSGHPHRGQRVKCTHCNAALTITSVDPFEVDIIPTSAPAKTRIKPLAVEAPCPVCDDFVSLEPPFIKGDQAICDSCGSNLVILSADPLELEMPLTIGFRGHRNNYGYDHRRR
jgi:hypothetical protein